MSEAESTLPADPQAYVAQVMDEIAEEVRLRRASGDMPARLERELDELFLAHSPVAGWGGDLAQTLRMVDAATFIDPVVPVESERAAGSLVKKGVRSMMLWYVGWVTHQMSQSVAAVSRALHIVDDRLGDLQRQVEAQRVPPAEVVELDGQHGAEAWWVEPTVAAMTKAPGRVLHAACGDGWLVRLIGTAGGDAYGVDPRSHLAELGTLGALDLRFENLFEHLRAVAHASLGGVVLSGIVDAMGAGERTRLLAALASRLAPDGTLVIHSATRHAWEGDDAPPAADLAPGRPLRPASWRTVLREHGYVTIEIVEGKADYLVTAVWDSLDAPGAAGTPAGR
ncbi:MAG TPA: methyltransferase domain-containing protein [Acidimicrobiales bacterium]|nr:methyltransferase domain-containing protein [Acidimicrobiales bacterium]